MIYLGDDRQEVVDLVQDTLSTTRPLAEQTVIALLKEGKAVTTNDGIFLKEDGVRSGMGADVEMDDKITKHLNKAHLNILSKKARGYNRNHIRWNSKKLNQHRLRKMDYVAINDDPTAPKEDEK